MKLVIPGGSGQVGTVLAGAFHGDGHDVVVLSRRPDPRPWRVIAWDGATLGNWQGEIDGCDMVINLAGRSVNCRYTAANREEILRSRVLSTRVAGRAIARAARQPRVWLQASTAIDTTVRTTSTRAWMVSGSRTRIGAVRHAICAVSRRSPEKGQVPQEMRALLRITPAMGVGE
jgi:NAD dependent epimerase/dehydratase family enzyme